MTLEELKKKTSVRISTNQNMTNSITLDGIAEDGLEVKRYTWNRSAERMAYGIRIETLGNVYELDITFPPSIGNDKFYQVMSALKPFVVWVEFFNPYLNKYTIYRFYTGDLANKVMFRKEYDMVYGSFKIKLIGMDTIK